MAESSAPNPFVRSVVLQPPGADSVQVTRDQPWSDAGRAVDVYRPPDAAHRLPAVILVTGFPDPGFRTVAGCACKDTAPFVSWARLLAASGLAAVTYSNVDPVADAPAVLTHLDENARALGIDSTRLGVWACSGHVPNALALLTRTRHPSIRCAALCYGYMLDLDGSATVADAGRQFKFAVPDVGIEQLPSDVPLLIARAGADAMPGLNDSIDRFTQSAESLGLRVEIIEHATGPHAFDVMDDSDASRAVIARVVGFLKNHLLA